MTGPAPFLLSCLFIILFQSCEGRRAGGSVAFSVTEKDLVPEGITYSHNTGRFYLSSIHKSKIVSIDEKSGACENFIASHEYGFLPGIGMWADDARGHLWAVGSDIETGKNDSRLFLFDPGTGALLKSCTPPDSGKHFLNDLVVTETGDVYVTDTDGSAVYRLNAHDELEVFIKSVEIEYPNGISYSPDSRVLFVASFTKGIRMIDVATKRFLNGPDTSDMTRGVDGLKYYHNGLIAIQNGFQTPEKHRIVRYRLNDREDMITDIEVIDENNPAFDIPTTFVIREDELYCIANSQLSRLNQSDNSLSEKDTLNPTIILRYVLR